jgi:hypothetical protein
MIRFAKMVGLTISLGCLYLSMPACDKSNADNETTLGSLQKEVDALTSKVTTLEALAPSKLKSVADLSGQWAITEVPEDNSQATISGTFQVTDTVNQTFTITNCPQCPMRAIPCTTGSVGFGPSAGGQGVISFTCSSTTKNLFLLSSRRSNISLLSVSQGVNVILSKDDAVVDF